MSNTNDFPPVAYGYTKLTELTHEMEVMIPGAKLSERPNRQEVSLEFHAVQSILDKVYLSRDEALRELRVLVEAFQNEVLYKTGAQVKVDAWRQELRSAQGRVRELEATLRTRNERIVELQEELTRQFETNNHMMGNDE